MLAETYGAHAQPTLRCSEVIYQRAHVPCDALQHGSCSVHLSQCHLVSGLRTNERAAQRSEYLGSLRRTQVQYED